MSFEQDRIEAEQDIKQGEEADKLLNNPQLRNWFTIKRANKFTEFMGTKAEDDATRREIWREMKVLNELEQDLRNTSESGKMAKSRLKEILNVIRGRR